MKEEFIYLDHAAATPVSDKVLASMMPYFSEKFYNPSAAYLPSVEVRREYESTKQQIAQIIGAKSDEVIMTAGATESINLAFSVLDNQNDEKSEFLVGEFEHHSVRRSAEKYGIVKIIKVNKNGIIDLDDLARQISPKTKMISVMTANNETGVIQPISKIHEIIQKERTRRLQNNESSPIYFHSDASQGVGQIDIHVARLGLDMMTLNGGKIYAPKQTGILWASREVALTPQIVGGGQERNLRSGTENVSGAVGLAKALYLADKHRKSENIRLKEIKSKFKNILKNNFTETEMIFIGDHKKQLNSHIAISFPSVDAERIVFALESQGVLVSTGSACAANKSTRSKTLISMGLSEEVIDGNIRISFGHLSNLENTQKAAKIISDVVKAEIDRLQNR